jgi:hypothetical protein
MGYSAFMISFRCPRLLVGRAEMGMSRRNHIQSVLFRKGRTLLEADLDAT